MRPILFITLLAAPLIAAAQEPFFTEWKTLTGHSSAVHQDAYPKSENLKTWS